MSQQHETEDQRNLSRREKINAYWEWRRSVSGKKSRREVEREAAKGRALAHELNRQREIADKRGVIKPFLVIQRNRPDNADIAARLAEIPDEHPTITGRICGDPRPGRSALDQQRK